MTVDVAIPTLLIPAGLVASASVARGGNVVVLAGPEVKQVHLHLGAKIALVKNRNPVAVVVVDDTVADNNFVFAIAVVRVVEGAGNGVKVVKTLPGERVVLLSPVCDL